MKDYTTPYVCPTCKMRTVQPSRTADAGTVYCTLIAKHKDKKNRIMKRENSSDRRAVDTS